MVFPSNIMEKSTTGSRPSSHSWQTPIRGNNLCAWIICQSWQTPIRGNNLCAWIICQNTSTSVRVTRESPGLRGGILIEIYHVQLSTKTQKGIWHYSNVYVRKLSHQLYVGHHLPKRYWTIGMILNRLWVTTSQQTIAKLNYLEACKKSNLSKSILSDAIVYIFVRGCN